ncbi:MAG: aminoglycoside phosphotransferase family protein [Pseudomonadota bacterium]
MHEKLNIQDEGLRVCLREHYDLNPLALDFIPLGMDSNAAVYRVVSDHGVQYLLKVRSGPFYKPGCLVPRYLQDQGIASVVAPLPTKKNALWTQLGDLTVVVYPFINGDTSWTGMLDNQWEELGTILKRIHHARPPLFGALKKEAFDPAEYVRWIHNFEASSIHSQHNASESVQNVCSSWREQQSTIRTAVASLETLAAALQKRSLPYVLCHADLHPANLLRDQSGRVFVIDWDEVMLAPRERDFIFIREPHADAFFQGYGQTDIDWMTLAYYLWERVVQDLIEFTRDICFRDDWKEETRADNFKIFHRLLVGDDGTIAAAHAAADHLSTSCG